MSAQDSKRMIEWVAWFSDGDRQAPMMVIAPDEATARDVAVAYQPETNIKGKLYAIQTKEHADMFKLIPIL